MWRWAMRLLALGPRLPLCCLCLALLATASSSDGGFKLCNSVAVDLTTTAGQIQAASNCTVISGFLMISIMNLGSNDSEIPVAIRSMSFPHLREVTGYVLLYRVSGLTSLDRLFPRLSVVRGRATLDEYSVVLFDMTHLTSLGLPWLRHVGGQRGLRVDNAPLLCYLNTVHWSSILGPRYASLLHFNHVQHQSQCSDVCPGDFKMVGSGALERRVYKSDCPGQCWNRQLCQTVCSQACGESGCRLDIANGTDACCHANCLAGCDGPGDRNCVACRHFRLNDQCVAACPPDYRELDRWLCIPKKECLSLGQRCVTDCPAGHVSDSGNTCKPCNASQSCVKHCPYSLTIRSASDLDKVRGCDSVDALTISLSDNIPDLDGRLHEAFANLTEIKHYLSVVQSRDLTTLSFLSGLRVIGGQHLADKMELSNLTSSKEHVSLSIQQTDFLQHLWNGTSGRRLLVARGRVLFHRNQRLCPRTVVNFAENVLNVTDGYGRADLGYNSGGNASNSNGNLALCIDSTFNLTVVLSNASALLLHWPEYSIRHPRYLLGYHVYYRLVPPNSPPVTYADPSTCEIRQWHTRFTQCKNVYASSPTQEKQTHGRNAAYNCHLNSNCTRCVGNCKATADDTDRNDIQCTFLITGLKPASQYAVFVVPYIIRQMHVAARSRLALAATLPDQPGPPDRLEGRALGSDRIVLEWQPPRLPNGNVTHYLVWTREIPVQQESFALNDYCEQAPFASSSDPRSAFLPMSPLLADNSFTLQPSTVSSNPTGIPAACPKCQCEAEQKLKLEQRSDNVLFEDSLLSAMMQKNGCPPNDPNCWTASNLSWFSPHGPSANKIICPGCDFLLHEQPMYSEHGNSSMRPGVEQGPVQNATTGKLSQMPDEKYFPNFENEADRMNGAGSRHSAVALADTSLASFTGILARRDACRPCPPSIALLVDDNVDRRSMPDGYTIVNGTSFMATELNYFVLYAFTVVACQGGADAKRLCSHPARLMVRTAANRDADAVPAGSLRSAPAAESPDSPGLLKLLWRRPALPNGAVKYYEVDASLAAASGLKRRPYICVSYQEWLSRGGRDGSNASDALEGGIALRDLTAGRYFVRVRAITLQGYGDWSNATVFDVAGVADPYWLLFGLMPLLLAAAAAAVFLACLVWWLRCRRGQQKATIVTRNPDYWSYTYEPDEWEVPRDQVTYSFDDLLGNGSFGCVYRGVVRSLNTPAARYIGHAEDVQVAVKNVSEKSSMRERHEFLQEAAHMKKFRQCAHVVRLIGVVSENVPTLVLMELMENGDLKNCLRSMREDADALERRPKPDSRRLATWCAQIADGMYYLETKKYIHRDLAARNCMVTKDYSVKIGDFGMTRDVNYSDYYVKEGQAPLPIRWMAPESLRDGIFSTATDVWSYGVVLWEIASLAQQPFNSRSNEEVLQLVKSGKTLEPPINSPDFMSDLMSRCWVQKPRQRASFAELLACLEDLAAAEFCGVSWYHNRSQQQLLEKSQQQQKSDEEADEQQCQHKLDLLGQLTYNELSAFPMIRAPMNGYV